MLSYHIDSMTVFITCFLSWVTDKLFFFFNESRTYMAQQVPTGTNTWSTIVTMCIETNIVKKNHLKLISDSIHTIKEAVMLTLYTPSAL